MSWTTLYNVHISRTRIDLFIIRRGLQRYKVVAKAPTISRPVHVFAENYVEVVLWQPFNKMFNHLHVNPNDNRQ